MLLLLLLEEKVRWREKMMLFQLFRVKRITRACSGVVKTEIPSTSRGALILLHRIQSSRVARFKLLITKAVFRIIQCFVLKSESTMVLLRSREDVPNSR